MHWKLKAQIQNVASLLPSSASHAAYYGMQRRFGRLQRVNPISRLRSAVEAWTRIVELGVDPRDKVFFEVGTGRVPCVPLAFWLMGARRTITIDLNPYLKLELTRAMVQYIRRNPESIEAVFGRFLDRQRLHALLEFGANQDFTLYNFLRFCGINYMAPADAANTGLEHGSIDFHTSFRVLEHIPPDVVREIIREGGEIISEDGLFVHRIDYGDHFAHSDSSITRINFLQYSDQQWDKYAGNRYMYMNRLRHDDFLNLFELAGHEILATGPDVDERCAALLRTREFHLDERFRSKTDAVLAISGSWILSRNRN